MKDNKKRQLRRRRRNWNRGTKWKCRRQ